MDVKEQKGISISVFLPCFNEQDNVGPLVNKIINVLESIEADFEVIIVNDGSRDSTSEVAEKIACSDGRVKVVNHKTNLGYGSALRSGFKSSTKHLVFFTDGDGQFDISEVVPLLNLMREYDVVTCYRINRQDNFMRRLNGFFWTSLVCFLFRIKIRDIDCAFKLFKRSIFDNIELESTGALIDTEILVRAHRKGYKITQTGVHHYPRIAGSQTGAKLRVIFRAFKELFQFYWKLSKEKN